MAEQDFEDKVIFIRRTAKTYKGGRRFRFGAMVVIGDRQGRVGVGLGKAKEVPIAVQKGQYVARRNLIEVPIEEPGTIPHEVLGAHVGRVVEPFPEEVEEIAASDVDYDTKPDEWLA